jgi:hypothetical protein
LIVVPFSRVFAPILARWVEANPELLTAPAPAEQEPADV